MSSLQLVLRYPKIQKNFNYSNTNNPPKLRRIVYCEGVLDKTIGFIDKSELTRKPFIKIIENVVKDNNNDWDTRISYNSEYFSDRYDLNLPAKFLIECFINSEVMNELEKSVTKNGIRELTLIIRALSIFQETKEGLLMNCPENNAKTKILLSEGTLLDIFW